uniref:uncharacterized protein LOC127063548 n=1 Tax=Vespula vulgaris TaxID=7454 RepID=UPI00223AEB79|nr:uncharacterized protein LOC127063548 [Vespula vulgaris]
MIGTPRRMCNGQPIVCPGPCNHRRHKRVERTTQKRCCHARSLFDAKDDKVAGGNLEEDDEDDDDEDGKRKRVDLTKVESPPLLVDEETITMIEKAMLVNVAISQILIEDIGRPPSCDSKGNVVGSLMKSERYQGEPSETSRSSSRGISPGSKGRSKKIGTKKMRGARKKPMPICVGFVLFVFIYAIVHAFLSTVAWHQSFYVIFLSSQICGLATLVLFKTTGTIPL